MLNSDATAKTRRVLLCTTAAGLLVAAMWLPFWRVDLRAPQYPKGLEMIAYGTEVRGDLREINIINHYVGMEHIDTAPAPEMSLFPIAMTTLVILALVAPLHRRLGQLALIAVATTPVVILVDLQRWLHKFGRNLDPRAPLRVEPFTPWVVGVSKIGNFSSTGMVTWGFFAMAVAALLLYFNLRLEKHARREEARGVRLAAVGALVVATALLAGGAAGSTIDRQSGEPASLQALIDAAPQGTTVVVPAGSYTGPIRIHGPLTVVAEGRAIIDGGGQGSVVEIVGDGVTLQGFDVRNSGRSITAEPAGIKVAGSRHTLADNTVTDVYFGIHLSGGHDNVVEGNRIAPGAEGGVRPGHAISLWHQSGGQIVGNEIEAARDGIYLSFADGLLVRDNVVTGCRYAVHSMYSKNSTFVNNRLDNNLLGAALMYSDGLVMRCNRIERHRRGATAYGVLLKDIDDLLFERNVVSGNRVGIYADNTPLGHGHEAIVRDNVLHGNQTALALQSNVALTFYGNRVVDNLSDVRSEGKGLSPANRWSDGKRGNYWDSYRGFDRNEDGIGDLPHRYEEVMNELIERSPLARAFAYTPASLTLERAARLFPLYRPDALLVDSAPLMNPETVKCKEPPR